ncbi:transglycosylase domain-containing protein [Microbacterium aoyamense]|uniref:Transglycosylase domain-containing protein n=1 Tax=Microbacterium aoyamense TaxID=344166 RepID=A0ABN2PZL8_9MICO
MLGGLAGLVGLSAVAGVLITATVTPAIAVSGYAASSAITMFDNLPSALDIEKLMLPSTLIYTNPDNGEEVEFATFYDQNRSPVDFDQVAPVMYDAILSSEDPRYYQHGGVDLIGTTRAMLSNLRGGGETQGGSSISQQYVKNILVQKCESNAEAEARSQLTDEAEKAAEASGEDVVQPTGDEVVARRDQVLAQCWTDATTAAGSEGIQRKLQEMRYAIALEQKYSKNDILLGYLNIANFGGQTYGIDAAAQYYFGVPASDVSIAQAATLAGMVQNPNTYRIDKPEGSISNSDGSVMYNKAPDGLIDDINTSMFGPLQALVDDGTITQEQFVAAADGYSATKGRQLYVLSRLLGDGKINQEQYVAAVIEPITPNVQAPKTGCEPAGGAAYFCQYVKNTVLSDKAFGETQEDRNRTLQRGGLKIYITMDPRLQINAEAAMSQIVPTSIEGWTGAETGRLGSATASIDNTTGRVLSIAQNTKFSENANLASDPNYSSLVYAGNSVTGKSGGFNVGSTFKLFTLIAWLEAGHSVNESLNGVNRVFPKMTNSCTGDWTNTAKDKIGNFGGVGGFVGTPMRFTSTSLNSGYLAMAEKLDLCDIAKVAAKMGVTRGDGSPIEMKYANNVIGDDNISPIAMAGAYGTVANNGVYCQPKVIDRVVDPEGVELPIPERTCTQVIDPKVAAAAALALQGVMNGGTGSGGNPGNAPMLGKTGTHEAIQSWLVESSTHVATAAWVGNSTGKGDIFRRSANGYQLSNMRYALARQTQSLANALYPAGPFSTDFGDLTRQVLADLPNVVGMPVDQAQKTLEEAGFQVTVGAPVDSTEGAGIVAAQDPGAGKAPGGSMITISPSNGEGLAVPDVAGSSLDKAKSDLRAAGFGRAGNGTCTVDATLEGNETKATGTDPAAGTVTNRNTQVSVNYTARECR